MILEFTIVLNFLIVEFTTLRWVTYMCEAGVVSWSVLWTQVCVRLLLCCSTGCAVQCCGVCVLNSTVSISVDVIKVDIFCVDVNIQLL
jgi:hypothetical protein